MTAVGALAMDALASTPWQWSGDASDVIRLRQRALAIPVQSVSASALTDSFRQSRDSGARGHEALDIPAPLGTPVIAVQDGRIAKLFLSQPGGITVYEFDPAREFVYYYAHLARYAEGLKEGMAVRRGDIIGYVGSTGNASSREPHLHFAVFRLGPERQWWGGKPINPFDIWRVQPPPISRSSASENQGMQAVRPQATNSAPR